MCPLYSFSICFDFPQLLIFPQINKNSFCRRFKLLKFLSLMLITNMLSLPSEIPTRHYRPITTSFSLFFIHPLALSDPFPSLLLSLFPIDLSPSRVFIQSLFLPFAPPSSFISFPFVSLATMTSPLTPFPIASLYIIYPLPLSPPPIFSFSLSHRSTPSSHLPPPFPFPSFPHSPSLILPPPPYISPSRVQFPHFLPSVSIQHLRLPVCSDHLQGHDHIFSPFLTIFPPHSIFTFFLQ